MSIALNDGWKKSRLTNFRSDHIDEFHLAFSETMKNAEEIHFNLKDVDIGEMWLNTMGIDNKIIPISSARSKPIITEAELRHIIRSPQWLRKTIFHHGEQVINGAGRDTFFDFLLNLQKIQIHIDD